MDRRVVNIKGAAGLGNRLFTLVYALEYAKRKNMQVLVDWSDGQIGPRGIDLFGAYFTCEDVKSCVSDWGVYDRFEVMSSPLLSRVLRFFSNGQTVWVSKKADKIGLWRGLILPIELQPFWVSPKLCLEFLPANLPKSWPIKVQPWVLQKATAAVPDIGLRVGVHVRYSDKTPKRGISSLIGRLRKMGGGVFLATDSEAVRQLFFDSLPDVVSASSQLHDGTSPGGLHHSAVGDTGKMVLFDESVFDLVLLSQSKFMLGQSNSTFSWAAIRFSNNDNFEYWDV